jgi:hypothetical protein
MRPKSRVLVAVTIATLSLAMFSCARHAGPRVFALNGRVVDAAAKPLAGAKVFVIWTGWLDVLADSQKGRIRICTTRTGPDGTWHVDAWEAPPYVQSVIGARSIAYLPGYNSHPPHSPIEHPGEEPVDYTLRAIEPGEGSSWDEVAAVDVADCAGKIMPAGENDRPFPATFPGR